MKWVWLVVCRNWCRQWVSTLVFFSRSWLGEVARSGMWMFTFTVQPKATQEAVRALWYFQSAGLAELWKQRREAINHLSKALHWGFFWGWAFQAVCGTAGGAHLWVLHIIGSANYSVLLKEKDPVKSKGTTTHNSQFTLFSTNLPCWANLCSGASSHLSSV